MAASPSAGLYRRLHNLRASFDLVLRISVDAMSVQRAQQNGVGWKGNWEER